MALQLKPKWIPSSLSAMMVHSSALIVTIFRKLKRVLKSTSNRNMLTLVGLRVKNVGSGFQREMLWMFTENEIILSQSTIEML